MIFFNRVLPVVLVCLVLMVFPDPLVLCWCCLYVATSHQRLTADKYWVLHKCKAFLMPVMCRFCSSGLVGMVRRVRWCLPRKPKPRPSCPRPEWVKPYQQMFKSNGHTAQCNSGVKNGEKYERVSVLGQRGESTVYFVGLAMLKGDTLSCLKRKRALWTDVQRKYRQLKIPQGLVTWAWAKPTGGIRQ